MAWCEQAIRGYTPSGNDFLTRERQRIIPQWYRDLLAQARAHVRGGEAPTFEFAPKPRKQDGWAIHRQILHELSNNADTMGLAEQDLDSTSSSQGDSEPSDD
jgi:hypothetical protein